VILINIIDFAVNDLEKAVQYAIHCGATITGEQFCVVIENHEIERTFTIFLVSAV